MKHTNLATRQWLTDKLWTATDAAVESIQSALRQCEKYPSQHLRWHAGGKTYCDEIRAARVALRLGETAILGVGDGRGNWQSVDVSQASMVAVVGRVFGS